MEFVILRWLHIVFGTFWAGAGIAMGWFVIPSLAAAGPGARPFMAAMQARKFSAVMSASGGITALVGIRMYMLVYSSAWIASVQGIAITLGAIAGLLALTVGSAMQARNVKRLAALGAAITAGGGAPTPEQQAETAALQQRMKTTASALAWLLLVATLLMSGARVFASAA